jgi:aspartate 1-decarboxylase
MDPQESSKDDIIIIISYATLEFEEAKTFKPWIIFQMKDNSLT